MSVVRRVCLSRCGLQRQKRSMSFVTSTSSNSCVKPRNFPCSLEAESQSLSTSARLHMSLVSQKCTFTTVSRKDKHRVFIALGSNMGDRVHMIGQACRLLGEDENIKVVRTSGLWETKAMYVVDQADFLNGACEVETTLGPIELLDKLQGIENVLNRVKLVDKGPRTIDLDILLFDNEVIQHERLQVPHKLMLERAFVLEPLAEMIPDHVIPTDTSQSTIIQHLNKLSSEDRPTTTLVPLAPTSQPLKPLLSTRRTLLMSILNLTPDSFSDGGVNPVATSTDTTSNTDFTSLITQYLATGATILDIGGQSTRPNAPIITADEETTRIIPSVRAISALIPSSPNPQAIISIDTFRSSVAQTAIEAGAHIINDVSGGLLDPNMLPTVAKLGCTIILMHMRGDPSTMNSKENTSYPGGLIPTIAAELLARVRAAEAAGIRRWRIILDPGVGFSKTQAQNLEILRRFEELRDWEALRGIPWLIGASRKGFIGKITGVKEPKERVWGTAAVVAGCVRSGADVVRVHDVEEMGQVAKMADAIWRV